VFLNEKLIHILSDIEIINDEVCGNFHITIIGLTQSYETKEFIILSDDVFVGYYFNSPKID
jgi:hypothetical protein